MQCMHDIELPFFYVPYFSDGSDEKSCEKVDIPSKEISIGKYSQKCKKNMHMLRFNIWEFGLKNIQTQKYTKFS